MEEGEEVEGGEEKEGREGEMHDIMLKLSIVNNTFVSESIVI